MAALDLGVPGGERPTFVLFLNGQRRVASLGGAPLVNLDVLARPAVSWSLLAVLITTGTYYALLFTLAEYLQQGLGDSALISGVTLVPWVAAFGVAGQLVQRLPARHAAWVPAISCLLLVTAYAAISATLFAGQHDGAPLIAALAVGGLGLGVNFSAILAHLSGAVPPGYAPDLSGISSTTAAIGGAVGVAAFATLYFSLSHLGPAQATRAFAIVTAAFAAAAAVAMVAARRATTAPAVARVEPVMAE